MRFRLPGAESTFADPVQMMGGATGSEGTGRRGNRSWTIYAAYLRSITCSFDLIGGKQARETTICT